MASSWYLGAIKEIGDGSINLNTADIRVLLLQDTYTFDATQNFVSQVAANEVSVASYTRPGQVANQAWTRDDGNNRSAFTHDNQAFGALETGQTVRAAVLYVFDAQDTAARLLVYDDGQGDTPLTGGDFTYIPPAIGHTANRV